MVHASNNELDVSDGHRDDLWASAANLLLRKDVCSERGSHRSGTGATQNGPSTFPIKVHVGEDVISFTNASTEAWRCTAELGFSQGYTSTFSVEPRQTRELSYLNFRGSDHHIAADVLRDAARGKISIECAEPSGRSHFWQFD